MNRTLPMLLALGMSLGLISAASPRMSAAAPAGVAPMDRKFMMDAAQGGMAEVMLGRLAMKKGASPGVRQFGRGMVEDHSKANQELTDLARSRSVRLPEDVKPEHKALYNRLARLNGAAFDRLYAAEMVRDHKEDVGEFKKAAAHAEDGELRMWARQTLPTLEDHLAMAKGLQSGHGGMRM